MKRIKIIIGAERTIDNLVSSWVNSNEDITIDSATSSINGNGYIVTTITYFDN